MYRNIKLISSDIDGTIVDKSHEITFKTVETIKKIQDRRIIFGLASGRPVEDLLNKYKSWGLDKQFDFIIGYNGGELYDSITNIKYEFNKLKKEWIKEIIELMEPFDANIHMYKPGIYLSSKESDRAWFSAFKNSRKFVVVDNIDEFYKDDNCGLMFRCKEEIMPKIEEKFSNLIDKPYIGFKTQSTLFEFSSKESNKGYALKEYLKIKQIDANDVLTMGDTTNDNKMLQIGHGICMKNGSDDTKACAEFITKKTDEEEGFRDFIEEYILND